MPELAPVAADVSEFPGVVFTFDPRKSTPSVAVLGANLAVGTRVVIPKSGTLSDLSIFIGTASGNVDVGVCSIPTVDTRTRLWSSGSTAAAGTNAWQNLGDPNLTVYRGQILDFVVAVDNGTVSLGRMALPQAAMGAWPTDVDATSGVFAWAKSSSFAIPASFSSVVAAAATTYVPLIVGKIT